MRWLLVGVLAGCHFEHGARLGDASVTADAGDAAIDTPSKLTCYDRWLDGSIRFATPELIPGVNHTVAYDRDPFLPADERTLYFSTGRTGSAKVFMATRADLTSPFGTPEEATPFSSTANEAKLSLSADNKIAVVASDRLGTTGGFDVWESIRTSTAEQWPAMNRTNVMLVESTGNEQDPALSANGQHLYLAPDFPFPQHIAVATRGSDGRFSAPVPIVELNSPSGDGDPSTTADERIMTFASNRSGNGDLYYATRANATGMFTTPALIPDVASSVPEGDPHLSSDGCRLYFARALSNYQYDLYVATAL